MKLQVFCLRYKLTFYHTQVWVSLPKKSRLRYIIYNRILLAEQRLLRENNNSPNRILLAGQRLLRENNSPNRILVAGQRLLRENNNSLNRLVLAGQRLLRENNNSLNRLVLAGQRLLRENNDSQVYWILHLHVHYVCYVCSALSGAG